MGLIQISIFLLAIQVARSAEESDLCDSGTIVCNEDHTYPREINSHGCENNITMVVIQIRKANIITRGGWCVVNATVAGINLCYTKPKTCIVVMPRDIVFKAQIPSDCEATTVTTKDQVFPLKVFYKSYHNKASIELEYKVHEMIEKKKLTGARIHRACDFSTITLDNLWQIRNSGCKNNITMVVVQITRISFIFSRKCYANATVAGINLCYVEPGTCIVVMPQDRSFEPETPSDCTFTIRTIRERVLPIEVSYKSYGANHATSSFELKYTLYESVEKKQDTTIPVLAVPQTETFQVPEKDATTPIRTVPQRKTTEVLQISQGAAESLAIVFGILFAIASVAFAVILYSFVKQRQELNGLRASAAIPSNDATTSATNDVVYSQVMKKRGPNNTSEAEVAVNELYHM